MGHIPPSLPSFLPTVTGLQQESRRTQSIMSNGIAFAYQQIYMQSCTHIVHTYMHAHAHTVHISIFTYDRPHTYTESHAKPN